MPKAAALRDRIAEVRKVKASELAANPRNFRTHGKEQTAALKGVLSEIGKAAVLVAYTNGEGQLTLIDGHLRKDISPDEEWTTAILDVTEAEAATLLATMDPIAALAGTDAERLQSLLDEVRTDSPALDSMLRDMADAAGVLYGTSGGAIQDAEPEIDRAEELQGKWQTDLGQVWEVPSLDGSRRHRIVCGDSMDAATAAAAIDGYTPDALLFDPPWDVLVPRPDLVVRDVLAFTDGRRCADAITLFGPPTWVFSWDCVTSWYTPNRPLQRMKLCLWYGDLESFQQDGAHYGDAGATHEVSNTRGSYTFVPDPRGKHLSDLFSEPITTTHANHEHQHQKPLAWVRLLIGDCTSGTVYDPFLGSGTSIVAAEQLGRDVAGVEINPGYVAVTLERLTAVGLAPARVV